jgi:DNA-directed RNA polymerase specialized sigma24 family protein
MLFRSANAVIFSKADTYNKILTMSKRWTLTQERFDTLLTWLHPDREKAAEKYENIRQSLIKIFTWRGVTDAEGLADETINRVTQKIHELRATYSGDPALYFYGVAKKIIHEHQRMPKTVPLDVDQLSYPSLTDEPKTSKIAYDCLDKCLAELSPANREIFLSYYAQKKLGKIDHRKVLAGKLGIDVNALRVRVHRIRLALERCIKACLQHSEY